MWRHTRNGAPRRPRPGAKTIGARSPAATARATGPHRERFQRARRESAEARADDGPVILYGWHTVTAALANPGAADPQAARHRKRRPAAGRRESSTPA